MLNVSRIYLASNAAVMAVSIINVYQAFWSVRRRINYSFCGEMNPIYRCLYTLHPMITCSSVSHKHCDLLNEH